MVTLKHKASLLFILCCLDVVWNIVLFGGSVTRKMVFQLGDSFVLLILELLSCSKFVGSWIVIYHRQLSVFFFLKGCANFIMQMLYLITVYY